MFENSLNGLEMLGQAPTKSSKTDIQGLKILKETHHYCPRRMRTHH